MTDKPHIALVGLGGFDGVIIASSELNRDYHFTQHAVTWTLEPLYQNCGVNFYQNGLQLIDAVDRLKPDVVHLIALPDTVEMFASLGYPTIHTSVGSETRLTGWKKLLKQGVQYADIVTAVSPDLLELDDVPEHATLTLNGADPNHFKRVSPVNRDVYLMRKMKHGKLSNLRNNNEVMKAFSNFELTGRLVQNPHLYPYAWFPNFLELFEIFFDVKYVEGIDRPLPLSRTALEFLTLGGNRVYHDGAMISGVPVMYRWQNFLDTWKQVYNVALQI